MMMMMRTLMTLTIKGIGPLRWRQQWNDFSEYPGQGYHHHPQYLHHNHIHHQCYVNESGIHQRGCPGRGHANPEEVGSPPAVQVGAPFERLFTIKPPPLKMWYFGCNFILGKVFSQDFVFTGITSGAISRELGRPDWRRRVEQKSIKISFVKIIKFKRC